MFHVLAAVFMGGFSALTCCPVFGEHLTLFAGDPRDLDRHGSPAFWEISESMEIEMDSRNEISRLLVMRKKPPQPEAPPQERAQSAVDPLEQVKEERRLSSGLPQKGERFHLAPTCFWPGKEPGQKPPPVEIEKDWTHKSGPVKLLHTGEVIIIHLPDLGGRIV